MDAVQEIAPEPQHSTGEQPPEYLLKKILPWLILAAVCTIYVVTVESLHPANFFGVTDDDAIYFTSAKALAEGRGYILPSIPGTPAATKYPILYPWLLSWIWRWNPSFPANLNVAVGLTLTFGCAYLLFAFLFLRNQFGLGNGPALFLTLLSALMPNTLLWSSVIMSDVPFAALGLAACILAGRAVAKPPFWLAALASGVATGAAIAMRTLGLPLAIGLYLAMALRVGWRKSTIFLAPVLPAIILAFWPSLVAAPSAIPGAISGPCADAWKMTWLYYTSYLGFWKADTIANHVLPETFFGNLFSLPLQPGAYFLEPRFVWPVALGWMLLILLAGLSITGIIRHIRQYGWQPIHPALLLYIGPLLIWDYAFPNRFLLPFLPLFAAGLWFEIEAVFARVRRSSGGKLKPALGLLFAVGGVVVVAASLSVAREVRALALWSQRRGAHLADKREAYEWLRENTASDSRALAFEHAPVYLYSGRQSIRPTTFWPAAEYRPEILNTELACIDSSAQPVDARFWLVADDDVGSDWRGIRAAAVEKEKEAESTLPLLFKSRGKFVRIYSIPAESSRPPKR
jgi:hypothetical protein